MRRRRKGEERNSSQFSSLGGGDYLFHLLLISSGAPRTILEIGTQRESQAKRDRRNGEVLVEEEGPWTPVPAVASTRDSWAAVFIALKL